MNLKEKLFEDMKQAMKAKETTRLGTIRLLIARIKNVEIDRGELNDGQVEEIVMSQIKQWQDAITDYQRGKREDLVQEAQQRIEVLQQYLPPQLSDQDLTTVSRKLLKVRVWNRLARLLVRSNKS
ncbi:MAG TPA: GatB/YqeY domain-containing protein [Candidatus Woesebacteria bacterium]|nr:GatB/YqeY domain-containing protein [Candidatus Woesebacteria bacterium]